MVPVAWPVAVSADTEPITVSPSAARISSLPPVAVEPLWFSITVYSTVKRSRVAELLLFFFTLMWAPVSTPSARTA